MSAHTVVASAPAAKPQVSLRGRLVDTMLSETCPSALVTWYLGLTPHWMGAGPRLRTRLLLRTHQWIVERIVAPEASLASAAADLRPNGELTRILTDLVPAAQDTEHRRRFIRALVANLRHALLRPVTRRNEAWVRWLFLIPYSVKGWDAASRRREPGGRVRPDVAGRFEPVAGARSRIASRRCSAALPFRVQGGEAPLRV